MEKLTVRFFENPSGRSPPRDFLVDLPAADRACILADVIRVAEMGRYAPVSIKAIAGRRGLREIRTRGFRTFFSVDSRAVLWVLHVCRKQDQRHGIEMAAMRMASLEDHG